MPRLRASVELFVTLSLGVLTGSAAQAARYEFTDQDWLAPAAAMPLWQVALNRHAAERAALRRCMDGVGECDRLQKSVGHILNRALALPLERRLRLVNAYVNKRRYKVDRRKDLPDRLSEDRVRNHWSTLMDVFRRGGDCEDFASAKYFLLRELGFAPEQMRIVVTYDRRARDYHAVLAVQFTALEASEPAVWLLDTDRIYRSAQHGHRFVYALNETGVWDHERRRRGT